jgi:predicted acetyltransferase
MSAVAINIRPASSNDLPEMARLDAVAFGFDYTESDFEDLGLILDPDRFLLACELSDEGSRIVGITGDYAMMMTVPGGAGVPVPGVTWVSVSPTHRRRGILRELISRQLRGYAEDGVVMAVLTASEGGIYRRFGYGPASQVRRTSVDRRRTALLDPPKPGSVQLATADVARDHLVELHARWRAQVPGAVSRSDAIWDVYLLDREGSRDGMTARRYLVHPDGYVGYRVKSEWADGRPQHVCWMTDFVAVTPAAHSALWQVLLGMDLFATIDGFQMPLNDPLQHLVDDPRQVRTLAVNDGIWVRPLDIAATLAARTYAVEIEAVLQIDDPMFGDGRYLLTGGPDGAVCVRSDRPADLQLNVDALGAVYLGGHRLNDLAAAGRVRADERSLLNRLDRAFLADQTPFHGTAF